jgi:hypothetical protein
VTKLSFVLAHKDKTEGFQVTLSCSFSRWYDNCGKGPEQTVELSRDRTTLLACLQELRKRLQDRALKLLPKKLMLIPPQLLLLVQIHQMFWRQWCSSRSPELAQKSQTSLLWTRRMKRILLNKEGFGRGWRRPTMLHTSNRKKISSFSLNVPGSINRVVPLAGFHLLQ